MVDSECKLGFAEVCISQRLFIGKEKFILLAYREWATAFLISCQESKWFLGYPLPI